MLHPYYIRMEWQLIAITISKSILSVSIKVKFQCWWKKILLSFFFSPILFLKNDKMCRNKNHYFDEGPSILCNVSEISTLMVYTHFIFMFSNWKKYSQPVNIVIHSSHLYLGSNVHICWCNQYKNTITNFSFALFSFSPCHGLCPKPIMLHVPRGTEHAR
jgi:hypothetical protein